MVDAALDTQLDRLTRVRGMGDEEAHARIGAQASREQRLAAATHVIDNNGTLAELLSGVTRVWQILTGELDADERTHQLAGHAADDGRNAWFEQLYAEAARGTAVVPWDRGAPHPVFEPWLSTRSLSDLGPRAIVVGTGFGSDAELLAAAGFETRAFDIAPTAVDGARQRHPESVVDYVVADLLELPSDWLGEYDLVVEIMTVQSMPRRWRRQAVEAVASLVTPGGTLVVVAAALDDGADPDDGPPWPLTREEVDLFAAAGLREVDLVELRDPDGAHRWRGEYRRPGGG